MTIKLVRIILLYLLPRNFKTKINFIIKLNIHSCIQLIYSYKVLIFFFLFNMSLDSETISNENVSWQTVINLFFLFQSLCCWFSYLRGTRKLETNLCWRLILMMTSGKMWSVMMKKEQVILNILVICICFNFNSVKFTSWKLNH